MRRTARLPLPLLLIALLLAGCTDPNPMPTPPPTPSSTPVFASDEEALAAAAEVYSTYIATVDAILADGGAEPDRLRSLVSDELFEIQLEGFESFARNQWHSIGTTSVRNFTLQQYAGEQLVMYVCTDVSGVDVLDTNGESKVSPSRPTASTFESTLEWTQGGFIVSADELWSGDGVC